MPKAKKAKKAKKPQSVIEYEKNRKAAEAAVRKLEKKYGGLIKLELKPTVPKKPPNAAAARKGNKLLKAALENPDKLNELINATREVGAHVVQFNPKELATAYELRSAERTHKMAEYRAQRKLAKAQGFNPDDIPIPEKTTLRYASEKALKADIIQVRDYSLKRTSHKAKEDSRVKNNFYKVIESYPINFQDAVLPYFEKMSSKQFSRLLSVYYQAYFKGRPNASFEWYSFWDSKGIGGVGRRRDAEVMLDMLGVPTSEKNKIMQEVWG